MEKREIKPVAKKVQKVISKRKRKPVGKIKVWPAKEKHEL